MTRFCGRLSCSLLPVGSVRLRDERRVVSAGEVSGEPLFDLQAPAEPRYGEYVATTWGREWLFARGVFVLASLLCVFIWCTPLLSGVSRGDPATLYARAYPQAVAAAPVVAALMLLAAAPFMAASGRQWEARDCWLPAFMTRWGFRFYGKEVVAFYCDSAPRRPFFRVRAYEAGFRVRERGSLTPWSSVGKVFLSRGGDMLVLATYGAGRGARSDVVVDVSPLGAEGLARLQSLLDSVLREDCVRFDRGISNGDRRRCGRWDVWDPEPRKPRKGRGGA